MSSSATLSTTITNAGPFLVSMEHENLCVISIPTDAVPTFAWWLIREYSLDRRKKNCFHSILMDDDGLSLICSTTSVAALQAINATGLHVSPLRWRAFVINITGSASEFPGAVHYLADSLSHEGLSILHISTFESEVFLVQEQDTEKACSVFRKSESPLELAVMIQEAQRKRTISNSSLNGSTGEALNGGDEAGYDSCHDDSSQPPFRDGFELCVLPGHVMLAKLNDDCPLKECSEILTKLMLYDERYSPLERSVAKGLPLKRSPLTGSCSGTLYPSGSLDTLSGLGPVSPSPSRSGSRSRSNSTVPVRTRSTSLQSGLPLEILISTTTPEEGVKVDQNKEIEEFVSQEIVQEKNPDEATFILNSNQNPISNPNLIQDKLNDINIENKGKDINSFMWGLWQSGDELTLLLDESDIDSFPENALTISPQRWRLIKLGGRRIEFHETGIVSAMSKIDPNIPSLNISTSTTNYALVPEELVESTLQCLSESLRCPVRQYIDSM